MEALDISKIAFAGMAFLLGILIRDFVQSRRDNAREFGLKEAISNLDKTIALLAQKVDALPDHTSTLAALGDRILVLEQHTSA